MFKNLLVVCLCILPLPLAAQNPPLGELQFIDPQCRVMDTRTGGGLWHGPIASNQQLPILLRSSQAWIAQGGPFFCALPVTARAAVVNLSAVQPSGGGHAVLWGWGHPAPGGSQINFTAGQSAETVQLVVYLCSLASCPYDLILSSPVASHWTLDLVGYYE